MKHPVLTILLAWLVALPALASSSPASPTVPKPSRLGMCAACHGTHGIAVVPGAPNLAGQNYEYLLHALKAYRDGKRDVAVMRAAAGPLSEAQMKQLARWFAAQPACASSDSSRGRP